MRVLFIAIYGGENKTTINKQMTRRTMMTMTNDARINALNHE